MSGSMRSGSLKLGLIHFERYRNDLYRRIDTGIDLGICAG
jgi:hypothetical protein